MADDLSDTISENAQGPKDASGDSGSISQHSLQDQIAADRYLKSQEAAQSAGLGVRLIKLVPPGAS